MEHVGITDGSRLRVTIHSSDPEIFKIFVTLPNNKIISIDLAEVAS